MSRDRFLHDAFLNFSDKGLSVIATDHRHIHDGTAFHVSGQAAVDSAANYTLHFAAPATGEMHLTWSVRGSGEANVTFYEDPTFDTDGEGTAVTPVNRKRDGGASPTMLVYHTPTVTDSGTLLFTEHFGTGRTVGGESRQTAEWELAPSTSYLLIITSEAAGNDINWLVDWYEED